MEFFSFKKKKRELRALHIDDSQWVRIPVSVLLRSKLGMTVYEAGSGPEGLIMAEREQPDVIILDVMMPLMDGFATLAKLKENINTQNIPVLMCTSRDLTREVNMAVRLGAVGYLTKPIEETMLIDKIKNVLIANGKWGDTIGIRQSPRPIPPDPRIDLVISKEFEPEKPETPAPPPEPPPPKDLRPCPYCRSSLKWISKYDAWYCYSCKKYPDRE